MIPVEFSARTDLIVIDRDPEMADYDNPRGEIYGHAAYVIAEAADGSRRKWFIKASRWEEEVLPQAQRQAAALNARLEDGKLPAGFSSWEHDRPAYGSAAYCDPSNIAEELAWEREMDDRY